MEIHDRIKQLRKQKKLTQEEFGKVLGVSRDVIGNIEYNRLARPEQKEPLIKLICKEFNVNEEWLRTGVGSMFKEYDKEYEFEYLVGALSASDNNAKKEVIKFIIELDDDAFNKGMQYISDLVDRFKLSENKK